MKFLVNDELLIGNFTREKSLILKLKYGLYSIINLHGNTFLLLDTSVNITELEWLYHGDKKYASTGSDFHWLFVKNNQEKLPLISPDYLSENCSEFYSNKDNVFYWEIPCGSGGGASVFYTLNKNKEIIGLMLSDIHSDDLINYFERTKSDYLKFLNI